MDQATIPLHPALQTPEAMPMGSELQNKATEPEVIKLSLLEKITNNFSKERKLGQGAYGVVYRGVQENGEEVAVKLLHERLGKADNDFKNELDNLMMLKHQNIVQLVGYCYETQREYLEYNGTRVFADRTYRALCFEYLRNGSLRKHLSDESDGLDWHQRYKIIKGTWEGLRYLHEGLQKPVYHLDLKPDNILLDHNMMPKLADFGMSKLFDGEQTMTMQTPIGTIGYLPMEYWSGNKVSNKLDIYSLGVVMIEIITGPKGLTKFDGMPKDFSDMVHRNWRKRIESTCSGSLLEAYCQQVKKCTEIALECIKIDRKQRPDIVYIIDVLNTTETVINKLGIDPGPSMDKISDDPGSRLLDHPLQLRFLLDQNKTIIRCPLHLTNNTDHWVFFWLHSNPTGRQLIRMTHEGIVSPKSSCTLVVAMYQLWNIPRDEPLTLNSTVVDYEEGSIELPYYLLPNISAEVTKKGRPIHKVKLTAVYVTPGRGDVTPKEEPLPCYDSNLIILLEGNCAVDFMDVHPSKPWIVIVQYRVGVRIWNYETLEMKSVMTWGADADKFSWTSAKFVARKKWIIVAGHEVGFNGVIEVYAYDPVEKIGTLEAHPMRVTSLAVHATEPYVLSTSIDGKIKLWDYEKDWVLLRTFHVMGWTVEQVVFNPQDTKTFASASMDCKIWDMHSGECELTLPGHSDVMWRLEFFSQNDELHLMTCSKNRIVKIWNCKTWSCVQTFEGQIGHDTKVICCHPELPILITGSSGGSVCLWNSTSFRLEGMYNFGLGSVRAIACLRGSRRIVIGYTQGLAVAKIPPPRTLKHCTRTKYDTNASSRKAGNIFITSDDSVSIQIPR